MSERGQQIEHEGKTYVILAVMSEGYILGDSLNYDINQIRIYVKRSK